MRRAASPRIRSFAPVVRADARLLILGSMPGTASLTAQQYYAHPQNQFWSIMAHQGVAPRELPYAERLERLQLRGLALWDVLQSCVRPGSLDAAIEQQSAVANDLPSLLRAHRDLRWVCCNGATAYRALQRHFGAQLTREFPQLHRLQLPSSSPAHARMPLAEKLLAWGQALRRA
jgi:TDG/mug DNA glycosylase family protein